jgi:quinohemoprotein amine dehydrogenase
MFTRTRCLFAIGLAAPALAILITAGETPVTATAAPPQSARPAAEGIPVTNAEVRSLCGSCHTADADGRMTRISYRRATPENWELTIKRMLALNDAQITPEQARSILKYLADNHGLAPEEARPIMFDAARRMDDFTYTANADTHNLCNACHTMGRVLSERRTPEEWGLLVAMHRGVYPGIDGGSGGFRRGGGGGRNAGAGGGRGANRMPMDVAVDHLSGAFPLMSAEWSSWSAARLPVKLAGKWSLAGSEPGKGPIYGEVTVAEVAGAPDSFTTTTSITYVKTGETVTRTGRAVIYAGFQWRGRSEQKATGGAESWREVSFVERDQNLITGRWFTGEYGERGMDVTLRRVARDVIVSGSDLASIKTGTTGQTVRIYGANLPVKLTPAEVTLGQGVTVTRVSSSTPSVTTVVVDVASDARVGPRDVSIAGSARPGAIVIYDRMDGLRVVPRAGMARLGGVFRPKQYQQFEARAFHNGPDAKPGTEDDLDLGMVDATWSLEEYAATFKEDDLAYVGELSPAGLFTPNVDGPNENRSGNRNNMGDVWAVAEYTPPGGTTLRGRGHLLVTVPLYMDWSSTEAGK